MSAYVMKLMWNMNRNRRNDCRSRILKDEFNQFTFMRCWHVYDFRVHLLCGAAFLMQISLSSDDYDKLWPNHEKTLTHIRSYEWSYECAGRHGFKKHSIYKLYLGPYWLNKFSAIKRGKIWLMLCIRIIKIAVN